MAVYDQFLNELKRNGPMSPHNGEIQPGDGELQICTNHVFGRTGDTGQVCYCEVRRSISKIEYVGDRAHSGWRTAPYIRVVLSCAHFSEVSVGSFPWRKMPRTQGCLQCGRERQGISAVQQDGV